MTYKLKSKPKILKLIDNNTVMEKVLREAEEEQNNKYYTHDELINSLRRIIDEWWTIWNKIYSNF